jgi:putative FmdB family regulatory protein
MPLYEYTCRGCGHHFEELVRGNARPACPSCASEDLEKAFSVFAVSVPGPKASARPQEGPCASCGHPDGPGACAYANN